MSGPARPDRPALLAFLALAALLTAVSFAQPPGPLGRTIELASTLGLTGLFFWLVARAYRRLDAWARPGLVPVLATLVAGLLGALVMGLTRWLLPQLYSPPLPGLVETAGNGAITGAMLLGIYVLVVRHPHALEQVRAGRVESELAALRARLEPHFLLNALNAIAGLVGTDPPRARRALAALGDLLSEAVELTPGQHHTVADEVAWLRAYLTIFEARYGEALEVEWVVGPDLGGRPLPRMLLQPLVENALVHGIAAEGAGRVTIALRPTPAGGMAVEISNTGPSVPATGVVAGHGLDLVRRRLALELPGARLRLAPGPGGGTVAALDLPAGRR